MKPSRPALVVLLTVATVAALAGYIWWSGAGDEGRLLLPAAVRRDAPPPLPELGHLAPAVQTQVRERHAAVATLFAADAPQSQRAEAVGSLAMLLLATESLADADAALLHAEMLAPRDMRWPYYRGHVNRMRQEPAAAIAAFERAVMLAPDDVPSLIWLGELHLTSGNAAAAETPLLRAAMLAPESPAVLSRLGRAALVRREYARAIDYLERTLRVRPDAAGVRYPLGMAYRAAGDIARAEAHLRQASDAATIAPPDPLMDRVSSLLQNASAFEARGMEALDARNWPAAVENLGTAARLAPDNAITRLNLGMAHSLAGDAAAARRELLEALRLDPTLAKAHFGLGVLARDEGRAEEAIERLSAAVRLDPGFVDARFTLAETLRRSGRAEASLTQYRAVLRDNAAASQARFGQAMALVRLRRYGEARRVLEQSVQLHPDQPGFPHALARVLAAAPAAADRDGPRALELMQPLRGQRSPAVLETMAMIFAELDRFGAAEAWQQQAITAAHEAGQPDLAARMQDNLARYRRREPCRTPWRDDDPVMTDR